MSERRDGKQQEQHNVAPTSVSQDSALQKSQNTSVGGAGPSQQGLRGPPSNLRRSSTGRRIEDIIDIKRGDEKNDNANGQAALHGRVDQRQLDEIRKGIIMPGMGGNRGNTEAATQGSAGLQTGKESVAIPGAVPRRGPDPPLPSVTAMRAPSQSQDANIPPSRSRAQPMLKASMLKKRGSTPAPVPKGSASTGSKPSSGPRIGQGTPARTTRYSLPVRAEKPVRTSKTTGKHVVLPSESQLAPLPHEEEDEEEDEEEESSSSEEVSDPEDLARADDELADDLVDEEREKAREIAKKRREENQLRLEEARKQKEARRQARKPAGAPGHPDTTGAAKARLSTGPAHARAPPRKPKSTGPVYHTFERLAPAARVHTPLPRLTSYAVSPSIHIPTLIGFLRREHSVRPRLYDECAYVVYYKPLLPGFGRAEVRSAPEPRFGSPGAESRREREIVEREESGYVGGYFAATGKDDEGDHIDEQGYIMGGEGRRQDEDEEEQSRRRMQHEGRGQNINNADLTETETERENDDSMRRTQRRDIERIEEQSESEVEGNRQELLSETDPFLSREEKLNESDFDDANGMKTPRALQPRRTESDSSDILVDLEPPIERRSPGSTISNADRAGAQDLRDQQSLIESGQRQIDEMPIQRLSSDGNDEKQVLNGNGNYSQRHHNGTLQRESSLRKPRRRKRKVDAGPNLASHNHDCSANMLTSRSILEALQVAELVILPYGILVMYNMSAAEERSIITDVISSGCIRGGAPYGADDEETEAFHFCYDPSVPAPRIFNDFFTFRASNHLLKLSLAHAIAQSTKLSVFEESMQQTLELTSHIPKELASSGELQLKRRDALRLTGRLFKLRVDVNLTSNVLDTPELFWSEASLKALYDAIREYLEIDQRVENLNERLAVGNDLLEVIHDHLGSQSMNQITWIIIILIVVACIVACGEITARLVLHARNRSEDVVGIIADAVPSVISPAPLLQKYMQIASDGK